MSLHLMPVGGTRLWPLCNVLTPCSTHKVCVLRPYGLWEGWPELKSVQWQQRNAWSSYIDSQVSAECAYTYTADERPSVWMRLYKYLHTTRKHWVCTLMLMTSSKQGTHSKIQTYNEWGISEICSDHFMTQVPFFKHLWIILLFLLNIVKRVQMAVDTEESLV